MQFVIKYFPEITIKSRPVRQQMCRQLQVNLRKLLKPIDQSVQVDAGWDALKVVTALAKTDLLILDDLGTSNLKDEHRRDLLEILDDRYGVRSTAVTSQFPVEKWHELIADPTLADAILDRLVHNAYKINLTGDSMRKRRKKLTQTGHSDS